jgi:predicted acylesterase/phospholipase RssA
LRFEKNVDFFNVVESMQIETKKSKACNIDIEMSWWEDWKPKILCLGAGGIKGLDELGTLWWFWSQNVLSETDSYIGSSIGGIICALLSIGYWPHEILTYAIDTNLFKDISEIKMASFTRDCGLISNTTFDDILAKRLKQMIVTKMGKIPTLAEHYKMTGQKLYLTISSLKERRPKYLSYLTDPDMDLFIALRSTSNMTGVFGKLEHQKDYYIDGAFMDPLPACHLDDGKTPMLVIGVMDEHPWVFENVGTMNYFERALSLPLKRLTEYTLANCSKACYCVIIPITDDVGLIESSTREARMDKFLSGYNFASTYVPTHPIELIPKVSQSLPPLSKTLINACLNSNAGQTLLRCMTENPELFEECTHLKPRVEVKQPSPRKSEVLHSPRKTQIARVTPIDDDDDIIEIPRTESRHVPRQSYFPRNDREFPFPSFGQDHMHGGVSVTIHIPREITELMLQLFMGGTRSIGFGSNSKFQLP